MGGHKRSNGKLGQLGRRVVDDDCLSRQMPQQDWLISLLAFGHRFSDGTILLDRSAFCSFHQCDLPSTQKAVRNRAWTCLGGGRNDTRFQYRLQSLSGNDAQARLTE